VIYDDWEDESDLPDCPCQTCCYRLWAKRLNRFIDVQHGFRNPEKEIPNMLDRAFDQMEARIKAEMGGHPQCPIYECLQC
jgi:hypothetical protein